jgi:2-phosphosulfolactate phosphatase
MYFGQAEFELRCEWGLAGLAALLPGSDVCIIVDVLSFCTCVDIAVGNGALVYPYRFDEGSAQGYADERGARLARRGRTAEGGYSLAPASLLGIPAGTRLVLPSPNGATLSLATGALPTFAGCLRNASAVARAAQQLGRRISVIAAGERWPDGGLRPALEDQLGAGAIIAALGGRCSPEAAAAEQAFLGARPELEHVLARCGSGQELIGRGFSADVALAAAHDQSRVVPVLRDGAYRAA